MTNFNKLFNAVNELCDLQENAADICEHGAASGFSGFTYYSDTWEFANKYRASIIELLKDQAAGCGVDWLEFLSSFNCLKDYDSAEIAEGLFDTESEHNTIVYNALAWYALEEAAHDHINLLEAA